MCSSWNGELTIRSWELKGYKIVFDSNFLSISFEHAHFWIRIYLPKLNYLSEGVKDVMNTRC